MQSWITQFRKGLAEFSVLAVLREQEAYGYQIVERLSAVPGLEMTESTVYPLLARLAADGCLSVRTGASPAGPPRRYYRLSAKGQKRFAEMADHWTTTARSVQFLLNGDPNHVRPEKPE